MIVRVGLSLALLLLAGSATGQHQGELPAVARPRFTVGNEQLGSGTVFFIRVPDEVGVAAVGTAHSFDLGELSQAGEVEFRLGSSKRRVAVSSRFYTEPGHSFTDSGATLRDDFVVFALDAPPFGIRILESDPDASELDGARVRILGVPAAIPQDEDDIFGRVKAVSDTRLEVELDVPVDLRGWGGAPVLQHPEGKVVGILEAAWPQGDTLRLGAAPIAGVLEALEHPLEGGRGLPFARFAPGGKDADRAQLPVVNPEAPVAISARATKYAPPEGETLLGKSGSASSELVVEIEHPPEGAIVGEATGAFLAGRALAVLGELQRFDVLLVLDTSASTGTMTGADINDNGIVGEAGLRGIFGQTDAGDSILAAEVAAARRMLRGLDPRSTRVGLVTFAGDPPGQSGIFSRGPRRAAITEEPLTSDYDRIERALDDVLARGPDGMTNMAEGLDLAWVELTGLRGGLSEPDHTSEKVILFFTDGQPTLPYQGFFEADNVKATLRAADRARRMKVKIHSFAIGPEALDGPVAVVEMAARTGGYFTPVRHPADLVDVIENVSFANIDEVTIQNLTTGAAASQLVTNADGTFSGLVPVTEGHNRIQVTVRSSEGSDATAEVTVDYAPGVDTLILPRELMRQRNRLLEQQLVELKRGRIAAEQERVDAKRKELRLEIERERHKAQERAEQQRKELDLEIEPAPEP
jgi:hypothetical protein